ncbi:MAG: hypothetical protein WKF80_01475 [Thermomicrobiales bacterium]
MASTPSLSIMTRPELVPARPGRLSTLIPFLIGTAVGIAAGTVVGALVGREIGHAVTDLVVHVDRREPKSAQPRFEYLLQ